MKTVQMEPVSFRSSGTEVKVTFSVDLAVFQQFVAGNFSPDVMWEARPLGSACEKAVSVPLVNKIHGALRDKDFQAFLKANDFGTAKEILKAYLHVEHTNQIDEATWESVQRKYTNWELANAAQG